MTPQPTRLLAIAAVSLAACGSPTPPAPTLSLPALPAGSATAISHALISLASYDPERLSPADRSHPTGMRVFRSTCALCHGPGIAGAPRLDDRANWSARVSQGRSTLYAHALGGFQGAIGVMPARGGNPALSEDEVRAAVDYMLERSGFGTLTLPG